MRSARTRALRPCRPRGFTEARADERRSISDRGIRPAATAAILPAAVVFDIAFTAETSRRQPDCVAPLVAEIVQLRKAGVKLYAAQDLESANGGGSITGRLELDPDFQQNQDERIYDQLTRSGHTLITSDPYLPGGALFYYPKALAIPSRSAGEGASSSCALPIVAVGRADDVCLPIVASGNEASESDQQVVTVGPSVRFRERVRHDADAVRAAKSFDDRFVLVGDSAIDTAAGDPRSKFEILSWAVNAAVAEARGRPTPRVLIDEPLMLGLASACALLALGTFLAVTRVFRKRGSRFAVATALAILVPIALLALGDGILRAYDVLYSQVAFPVFGIVVTTAIALWAAVAAVRRDLFVTQLQRHETAVVEKYDVFISYARTPENTQWVEENVLEPLSAVVGPSGRPLRNLLRPPEHQNRLYVVHDARRGRLREPLLRPDLQRRVFRPAVLPGRTRHRDAASGRRGNVHSADRPDDRGDPAALCPRSVHRRGTRTGFHHVGHHGHRPERRCDGFQRGRLAVSLATS